MKRAVVTGLGFITSIGNHRAEVLDSLRTGRTGIEIHPDFARLDTPAKLAGTVKGFAFPEPDYESWELPPDLRIPRVQLRSLSPHGVYAHAAMREAIADAKLPPELVSQPRTGAFCASAGSTYLMYHHADKMVHEGAQRCPPLGVASAIAGTLNFNLCAHFGIQGASGGFASACASSAHAFGAASDLIRLGRQDVMFVVGAEDCDFFSILPFVSCRALTRSTDPHKHPCAFDTKRDGFVGTGGATVLILEEEEHARARGAHVYAHAAGWGQSTDGFDVMAPEPNGAGLVRAMQAALEDAGMAAGQIDYINAHATSTSVGDRAEMRAIRQVFPDPSPLISTTKSQTGHGLSLAGAMEAAFCCLALEEGFVPTSLNITDLDPEAGGLRIITTPTEARPRVVMSNSSGFGGANVALILTKAEMTNDQ